MNDNFTVYFSSKATSFHFKGSFHRENCTLDYLWSETDLPRGPLGMMSPKTCPQKPTAFNGHTNCPQAVVARYRFHCTSLVWLMTDGYLRLQWRCYYWAKHESLLIIQFVVFHQLSLFCICLETLSWILMKW